MDAGFSKLTKLIEGIAVQAHKLDRDQVISEYRLGKVEKRVDSLEQGRPS